MDENPLLNWRQEWGIRGDTDENMREPNGLAGGDTERESNGSDILTERTIRGLEGNLMLAKF